MVHVHPIAVGHKGCFSRCGLQNCCGFSASMFTRLDVCTLAVNRLWPGSRSNTCDCERRVCRVRATSTTPEVYNQSACLAPMAWYLSGGVLRCAVSGALALGANIGTLTGLSEGVLRSAQDNRTVFDFEVHAGRFRNVLSFRTPVQVSGFLPGYVNR